MTVEKPLMVDFIVTPVKNYVPVALRASARHVNVRQVGIPKVVVVRTKNNGGIV